MNFITSGKDMVHIFLCHPDKFFYVKTNHNIQTCTITQTAMIEFFLSSSKHTEETF